MTEDGGVIERYFEWLTTQNWEALKEELSPEVARVGPFGDRVVGRHRYLDFLMGTVPPGYGNDVHRVVYAPDGRSGFARVSEHLSYPGREVHLEEMLSFLIDEEGRLSEVEVFWQTPQLDPGGFGSARSEKSYASQSLGDRPRNYR